MSRDPIPSWHYALVIVQKDDRFLIVQERKHGQSWYLPAGRVERGETFEQAARRETLEEAGIKIELTHVFRIEHTPKREGDRLRVIFRAIPADNTPPKSVPDAETMGASWVRLDELDSYQLRAAEVKSLFEAVENGCPLYPLDVLQRGSPDH
ncbi:MAG: NUDIX domain-containing protein [Rubripirellula sp.]